MKKIDSCQLCGKSPQVSYNRPKSLHRTSRMVKPNLQKFDGVLICSRCRRTLAKKAPAKASAKVSAKV